jgi:hypothetical protein
MTGLASFLDRINRFYFVYPAIGFTFTVAIPLYFVLTNDKMAAAARQDLDRSVVAAFRLARRKLTERCSRKVLPI